MIVSADELITYMGGIALDTTAYDFVQDIVLPGVQQELETYLNRPVEPIQVREPRRPDCDGNVVLTVSPVWKVLKIDYMGDTEQVPDLYQPPILSPVDPIANRIYDPSAYPQAATSWMMPISPILNIFTWSPLYSYGYNPRNPPYVVVNYIGGWNGYVEAGLKLAIMRVAAREVERNLDDTLSLRGGAAEVASYSDLRDKGWTDDELYRWNRLRRPVMA